LTTENDYHRIKKGAMIIILIRVRSGTCFQDIDNGGGNSDERSLQQVHVRPFKIMAGALAGLFLANRRLQL
jgi:hypothetical protein